MSFYFFPQGEGHLAQTQRQLSPWVLGGVQGLTIQDEPVLHTALLRLLKWFPAPPLRASGDRNAETFGPGRSLFQLHSYCACQDPAMPQTSLHPASRSPTFLPPFVYRASRSFHAFIHQTFIEHLRCGIQEYTDARHTSLLLRSSHCRKFASKAKGDNMLKQRVQIL